MRTKALFLIFGAVFLLILGNLLFPGRSLLFFIDAPRLSKQTAIFSSRINKLLPEPQASLLNGILWGERRKMPKAFYNDLVQTGTLHVIALSGLNITILVNLLGKMTLFLGRKRSAIISIFGIFLFILFVGASPSVVRAGIMGGISLLAVCFGRKTWSLLSLLLTSVVMLLVNPSWLKEISFQLSFLATLGMIILNPTPGKGKRKGIMGELIYGLKINLQTTLAAQLFTLPVIIFNFRQISLISPLTNVLILWVVQPIMVLGFILSFISLISLELAGPFSWIVWAPLTYFIEIVKLTANLPISQITF